MTRFPPPAGVATLVAKWLGADVPQMRAEIVALAFADLGELELPPGSNRSARIDEINEQGGSPLGSFWCANAVAAWLRAAGADTPGPGRDGSCDAWLAFGQRTGSLRPASHSPLPGDVVIYGRPGDATHLGVVVRSAPMILTVEGNANFGGFTRNGIAVSLRELDRSRVLGFCTPRPHAL